MQQRIKLCACVAAPPTRARRRCGRRRRGGPLPQAGRQVQLLLQVLEVLEVDLCAPIRLGLQQQLGSSSPSSSALLGVQAAVVASGRWEADDAQRGSAIEAQPQHRSAL